MDMLGIAAIQDKVARAFAHSVPHKWDHLVASCEAECFDGDWTEDILFISFSAASGKWAHMSEKPSQEVFELFSEFARLMAAKDSTTWFSCHLQMEKGGKYRYSFSAEPPLRLRGVFDSQSLLKDYVPIAH